MSLKSECRDSIYSFASPEKQSNAALFGEYVDYVSVVITLHRDEYKKQLEQGAETFTLSEQSTQYLTENKPY